MVYGRVKDRARHQRDRRPPETAAADGARLDGADRRLRRRPGADPRFRGRRGRGRDQAAGLCRGSTMAFARQPLRGSKRVSRYSPSPLQGSLDAAASPNSPGFRPTTTKLGPAICCTWDERSRRRSPAPRQGRRQPRDLHSRRTASPATRSPAPAPAPPSSSKPPERPASIPSCNAARPHPHGRRLRPRISTGRRRAPDSARSNRAGLRLGHGAHEPRPPRSARSSMPKPPRRWGSTRPARPIWDPIAAHRNL